MNTNIIAWKNAIRMPYRWRLSRTIMTRFSGVGLSSLSTTASPLSAMVPASSLVAQSENFFSLLFFFPCCSKWKLFLFSIFLPLLLKVKTFSLLFFFPRCSKWRLFLSSISLSMRHTVDGDVCHFSYSQVGLLWSRGRALLLRLLCWLQVEQDKTPNPDEAQDKMKHLILTWQ